MLEQEPKPIKKWEAMSEIEKQAILRKGIYQTEALLAIKSTSGETTGRDSREPGLRLACCGLYSMYFADFLSHAGIEVRISSAEKVNEQRHISSSKTFDHKFAVVGSSDVAYPGLFRPTHIVDLALCQFVTIHGEIVQQGIGKSALQANTQLVEEILAVGFFPFTPDTFSVYMELLTDETAIRRHIQPELAYFTHT